MMNRARLIISLSLIATFLFSICAISSADEIWDDMCLSDNDFTNISVMDKDAIEQFLSDNGSFLQGDDNEQIYDVDGTEIDPAQIIYDAAKANGISPQVILAQLQKESGAVTHSTLSETLQKNIMGYNPKLASTIQDQITLGTAQMGRDYNRLCNGETTISGRQVGVTKNSLDPLPVTPASKAVAVLFTYTPWVGKDWGGRKGGNALFCEMWNKFKFGIHDLIIEDWENGQNWTTENPISGLSLETVQPYEGKGSLKIGIAEGYPEAEKYSNDIYPDSYYVNEQSPLGQRGIPGGFTLSSVEFYTGNSDVYAKVSVYEDTENLPGVLVGTSDAVSLLTTGYKRFSFEPALKLNSDQLYNFILEYSSGSGELNAQIHWTPVDSLPGHAIIYYSGTWYEQFYYWSYGSTVQMDFTLNINEAKDAAIAKIETLKDCSNRTKINLAVKSSGLTGNILNFIYGIDKDHTISAPLTVTSNDWQVIEIPISNSVDTSQLSYFAFELGTDAIDSTTDKSKQNTIFIDQIEAE